MDKDKNLFLEDIDKRWKQIGDHYESLFRALNCKENNTKEESLFWEQEAFVCIWNILMARRIEFNTGKEDVRPIVIDENGTKIEIDFRIFIDKNPIYFDVTHFSGKPRDLKLDKVSVNIPIYDCKTSKAGGSNSRNLLNPRIVAIGSHKEYLNRKIAVRIAKEGRHKFSIDHVYIFIPKVDIGFGGGIDSIPADFNFDESSCYTYQETSIKGVILIGSYTDIIKEGSQPNEKKLIVRTKVFPSCSSSAANFLKQIDCSVLDRSEFLDSTSKILDK
jgi:hypothetical protein